MQTKILQKVFWALEALCKSDLKWWFTVDSKDITYLSLRFLQFLYFKKWMLSPVNFFSNSVAWVLQSYSQVLVEFVQICQFWSRNSTFDQFLVIFYCSVTSHQCLRQLTELNIHFRLFALCQDIPAVLRYGQIGPDQECSGSVSRLTEPSTVGEAK